MRRFRYDELAALAHELTLSPTRHRLRQIAGVLRAIDLVRPGREYPYSFVCFQITGYRPRRAADTAFEARDLVEDLVGLLDRVTAAHPVPAWAVDGPLCDIEALARRFRVSTKTISRWRSRGLAAIWCLTDEGKAKLVFPVRALQRFVFRNLDLVRRGTSFSLMGVEERAAIVARARELAAGANTSFNRLTRRLAAETGRAVETIRYTLRRHDEEHPDRAVFDPSPAARPLDEAVVVYEACAAGKSVAELARERGVRESRIRAMILRGRVLKLVSSPIEYVFNETFQAADAEQRILGEEAAPDAAEAGDDADELLRRMPDDLPPYLRDLYRTPLLSKAEEVILFRRMNFLLHQSEGHRKSLAAAPAAATLRRLTAIEEKLEAARAIKNRIVQANLRLVVSIARRHLHGRPGLGLFELVSEGNIALMRAVEKFDYARGFRFSTYATWAVVRSFARLIPQTLEHGSRYQTGREDVLETAPDPRAPAGAAGQDGDDGLHDALTRSLAALDAREREIIQMRFGLGEAGPAPQTLEEVGRSIGISKERVRQIELRALAKLRGALEGRSARLMVG